MTLLVAVHHGRLSRQMSVGCDMLEVGSEGCLEYGVEWLCPNGCGQWCWWTVVEVPRLSKSSSKGMAGRRRARSEKKQERAERVWIS